MALYPLWKQGAFYPPHDVVCKVLLHLGTIESCIWRASRAGQLRALAQYFIAPAFACCKSSLVPCVQLVLWHDHISKSCYTLCFLTNNHSTSSAHFWFLGLRKNESAQALRIINKRISFLNRSWRLSWRLIIQCALLGRTAWTKRWWLLISHPSWILLH